MEAGSSSVRGERMPMTMVQASVKNGPRRGRIKNKQISFWNEINQFINLYVIPYPIKKIINNLKTCYFFFLIADNLFQFIRILLFYYLIKYSLLILIQNRFSYKIFSRINHGQHGVTSSYLVRSTNRNTFDALFFQNTFDFPSANSQQPGKRVRRILDARLKLRRSGSVLTKHLDNVLQQMQALRREPQVVSPPGICDSRDICQFPLENQISSLSNSAWFCQSWGKNFEK